MTKGDLLICKISGDCGIFLGRTYQDLILVFHHDGKIYFTNIVTWKVLE
jgi:hypothetical protein